MISDATDWLQSEIVTRSLSGLETHQAQLVTHRYPGAGSDSGHKLPLFVGCLPLDLLEAVQSGREIVQQALFLYLSLTLQHTWKTKIKKGPKRLKRQFPKVP